MCLEGTTVFGSGGHGAHAKYMKVPVSTLVPLPDELSFEVGAAISCGTGTAYGALRRLSLHGDETIAIFGQGPVGLSATQLAVAMGTRVIALDTSPERRELLEKLIDLEAKAAECRAIIAESQANLQKVRTDFDEFKALRATKRPAPPIYDDVDF